MSPVTNLVAGTGAVSRYKLSRRQKFITVQEFNCGQMRVSWCNGHYEFVLGAGVKAKSVTNNLPILSVLEVSKVKWHKSVKVHQCRFAEGVAKICRLRSWAGFANLTKQNRELQYANAR